MGATSFILLEFALLIDREVLVFAGERAGWETHRVRLNRVSGYGFGIAVSGGRDNPHFASGDPSIAVSDVLRGGPAEDKLQVNDRIVSVNGISLENVEYARAVQVLRESGNSVTLVVRRRAMIQPATHTVRATLTRPTKKDEFGIVLGCKLYIKELSMKAREQLTSAGQSLCEGDIITRINSTACSDSMTLKEAKKLIESCKDRLNLVVTRDIIREETVNNGQNAYQNNYNSLGAESLSPSYSGQNLYVAAPSRGDAGRGGGGRCQVDGNEQPPRPPLPRNDDYYSRRQIYEEDSTLPRSKSTGEPRLISFQKEGSVGVRVSGGNVSGVFVSGVQAGSPAALQGLRPQDKILKVNDMEMKGITREEAVLFLLSLQERIDLIVQHSPEEYHAVASGQCPGDSFHIRCHFAYTATREGELSFKPGDVFHVTDTLHRGTVGAWQVARIGRNNQEVQKGIIPNKARAEELATAQFNASKKELNANTDSRGNFFRRRRSTHRRSKSLGKEQWDEVVADMSRQEAYERVVLRSAPGPRPVLLLGAGAQSARAHLAQRHPTLFAEPQMEGTLEDSKSKSSGIIRLSNIRNVIERGKHPLLDVTPNAVEKLNYAQLYPIVIFVKVDNKATVKQLRAGLPKSAQKSSKKLLEAAQQIERSWSHIFTHSISVTEANMHNWSDKLYDLIQRTQQQQIWVSETKPSDALSDDFLFPMSTTTENRLSYASSPESDLEVSPPPTGRLVKASSDPSVATTQDIIDRNEDLNLMNDNIPPPYTSGYCDSKYGFSATTNGQHQSASTNGYSHSSQNSQHLTLPTGDTGINYHTHSPPVSPLYGTVPDLPPRVGPPINGMTNGSIHTNGINGNHGYHNHPGPPSTPGTNANTPGHLGTPSHAGSQGHIGSPSHLGSQGHISSSSHTGSQGQIAGHTPHRPPVGGVPLPTPPRHGHTLRQHSNPGRPSAQERLFGTPNKQEDDYVSRVPPPPVLHNANSYEGVPTYDYGSLPGATNARLGPNAPDDLKVAPPPTGKLDPMPPVAPHRTNIQHEHHSSLDYRHSDPTYRTGAGDSGSRGRGNSHARGPSLPSQGSNEHKYGSGGRPTEPALGYKPVPPPKPKHYRPPEAHFNGVQSMDVAGNQDNRAYNYWPHSHYQPQQQNYNSQSNSAYNPSPQTPQSPPYTGPPPHRAINLPHNPHLIDLAGSREQRGSAFELYRKPQHMHSMSGSEVNASLENDANATPKTKKKLSKKHSFIKNAVLDLFRSKSKNTHKVSRQKSLCEKELNGKNSGRAMPILRREKSDLTGTSVHHHNTQIRNQMLTRSNSSCERAVVKPILKRESSFCDGRSGITCTVREFDAKPVIRNLRRQSSMSEIETETKITPVLRRQNSLNEHNRRGVYVQSQHFNMITKIDPVYQREQSVNHESYCSAQAPPEPIYQTKEHIIYDPIPKPRRTYAHNCSKQENPYTTTVEINTSHQNYENPYDSRPVGMRMESPYATRSECLSENPYSVRQERQSPKREPTYNESPYGTKEQILKQRMGSESPYSTKEEMLRHRFSESPYSTKEELLKSRIENNYGNREPVYGSRTYDPPPAPWVESPYGTRGESRRVQTPINYPGRISPMGKCMSEPPYATKTEMLSRVNNSESPYSIRSEVKSTCSEAPYACAKEVILAKRPASVECAYVSRQEILSQKAANKESIYGKLEDKLELIKQRNQAKKEMIYQSRREVLENDSPRIREPIYVSKRELKECIIYEAHNEGRETSITTDDNSANNSPYELSDATHLSRTPVSPVKADSPFKDTFREIDFASLRLTESKTDYEKEKSLQLEAKILKGEPIYESRLPVKESDLLDSSKIDSPTIPYESTTSMETNCVSEFSMNFDSKPQSTPYASQDLENQANENKQTRSVTFCDIAEKSGESSDNFLGECSINNETTVENTVLNASEAVGTSNTIVEPDGPHTTWGIFDCEGGVLEDRQWGVSLVIPPKAIAPGLKQKIYFTVSDPRLSQTVGGPPIDMDNGEAMLSPLVMCGPQGLVFLRPVTLRLPHCANAVPSLGLTLKATDTEAHLSTDWDNYQLPATTTLNTVAVKVDHF